MLTPPRYLWFGLKKWIYVDSKEEILSLKDYFTKLPSYISSFIFPKPNIIFFDRIVFDIDHPTDLNIPYKAVSNLANFCEDNSIPYEIVFSGGHGFHFYIYFKPYSNIDKQKLLAIQIKMLEMNDIGTIDGNAKYPLIAPTTLGKFRQLFRLPNSKYINLHNFEENGHYCRWISKNDFKKGMEHVLHISENPSNNIPILKSSFNFDEIIKILFDDDISIPSSYYKGREQFERKNGKIPKLKYLPNCLQTLIKGKEPSHLIRLETTAFLKFLGYNDEAIFKFYKQLVWQDWNEKITKYQISTINPRLPACIKIRATYGDKYCKDCIFRKVVREEIR